MNAIGNLILSLVDDISPEETGNALALYRDKLLWALNSCANLLPTPDCSVSNNPNTSAGKTKESSYEPEEFTATLYALLKYHEKIGKLPTSFKALGEFVSLNADNDMIIQLNTGDIVEDLEKLNSTEKDCDDPKMYMQAVYTIGRMNYWLITNRNFRQILIGNKQYQKESGIAAAQAFYSNRMVKDMGGEIDTNGLWHENTDAIIDTLNEKAKGACIKTLIPAMDDNWMLKLGKTLLIAGTSGDGKTTLMLTLLYNFALKGHNVVLFTLEDPQKDVWVKLAFIHTARFKKEFDLPSLFEWEQRMAYEAAGERQDQWLTPEEKTNMRDVIISIQRRDRVPGLIDVQPINEWSKMKAYTQAKMAENKYSVMAVDYFGERMETSGDPRWRDKEINAAAGDAINFAQANNMLLVAPVQVKKNLRDAYSAEFVDVDPTKTTGFVAPYDDIAAVKADQIQALPQGADYCIGVWSGNDLKKKNQGLICCMKFRPTVQFPCFRFKMDKASKYIRDAGRGGKATESSIELSTSRYDLSQEL